MEINATIFDSNTIGGMFLSNFGFNLISHVTWLHLPWHMTMFISPPYLQEANAIASKLLK